MIKLVATILVFISLNLFAQTAEQLSQGVEMGKTSLENDQSEPRTQNSLVLRKYDEAQFLKAQESNKKIVLVFSKSDCPACNSQVPTLQKILKEPEFADIEIFQIDFINQPELAKKYNIPAWTFLLGYNGKVEKKRIKGLIKPSQLRIFLRLLK